MEHNKIIRSHINYVNPTRFKSGILGMMHGKKVSVRIGDTYMMTIDPHNRTSPRGAALLNQVSTQRDIITRDHKKFYISREFTLTNDDELLNKSVRII